MNNCDCKEKDITVLGGKGSLLGLIRRVDTEKKPVKSETIVNTEIIADERREEEKHFSIDDVIEIKRLNFILKKIEELRNIKGKSIFCKKNDS